MGVAEAMARLGYRSPSVLVVEAPGHWLLRAAVERGLGDRGWAAAASPAQADMLLVCGEPGEQLAAAIDTAYEQMPGPRARTQVRHVRDLDESLDTGQRALLDLDRQRGDASDRPDEPDVGDMGHGDMGHGDMGHGDMDMGHGDMDMAPHGIPLATGAEDRDGLEMDVLNVSLGPVLAHWPPGLVVRCVLHGDVVTAAVPQVLDRPTLPPDPTDARERAARWCDHAADLLALAGPSVAAVRTRRLRDQLLSGDAATAPLARLRASVSRSWLLPWSLRGLGALDEATSHGVSSRWLGDAHERLLTMLSLATAALDPDHGHTEPAPPPLAALPKLVTGLDVAAARLVIASLALDVCAVTETSHA